MKLGATGYSISERGQVGEQKKKKSKSRKPQERKIGGTGSEGKNWLLGTGEPDEEWRWHWNGPGITWDRIKRKHGSEQQPPNPAFCNPWSVLLSPGKHLKHTEAEVQPQKDLIRILGLKSQYYCYYFLFPRAIRMCSVQAGFGTAIF